MKRNYTLIPLCLVLLAFIACSNNTKKASDDTETTTKSVVNVPQFNADSAYQYVKAQVDFGPRVPNTKAHVDCGNYLDMNLNMAHYWAKRYAALLENIDESRLNYPED